MKYFFTLLTISLHISLGCAAEPSKRSEVLTDKCDAYELEVDAKNINFYQDILPILQANTAGHSYKCTTCHAHYAEAEGLNNVPEINRIIDSMETGRMPRSNNKVSKKFIDMFRTWQKQGFRTGDRRASARSSKINGCLSGMTP
jgi:hypothetical protein